MAGKFKEKATIVYQSRIAADIYSMWLQTERIAAQAVPGQFVSLYCNDASRLLPRPISICEINPRSGMLRLVYRVAGKGTEEFASMHPGDTLDILGPLGNGFPLGRAEGKRSMLIGGGIGLPPMVELCRQLPGEKTVVAGFRSERFLMEDFEALAARTAVATEDGSFGTKGTVLDAIREQGLEADIIYACGPTPMLRAVKEYAVEKGAECWLSMEERMGCGIGACLACVCQSKEIDGHSRVHNKRVCKEGPVFEAGEVEL